VATNPIVCTPDNDNGCFVSECVEGACIDSTVEEGTTCDDGLSCTVRDQCNAAGECSGSTRNCNDNNPCTTDTCDETAGCVNTPSPGASCNDNNACTEDDVCTAEGSCEGTSVDCPENTNACLVTICSPQSGCGFTFAEDDTPCDDFNENTANDTCQNGQCIGDPVPEGRISPPPDTEVPCGESTSPDNTGMPTGTGQGSDSFEYEDSIQQLCGTRPGGSFTIIRTWRLENNDDQAVQLIRVIDRTPPQFTNNPDEVIVECDGSGDVPGFEDWLNNDGRLEAEDNCSSGVDIFTVASTGFRGVSPFQCGTNRVTFATYSACQRYESPSERRTLSYTVEDTQAPSFERLPQDMIVLCSGSNLEDRYNQWLASGAGSRGEDVCAPTSQLVLIVVEQDEFSLPTCGESLTLTATFAYEDPCGNRSPEESASFIIENAAAPEFVEDPLSRTVQSTSDVEDIYQEWLSNHAGAASSVGCGTSTITNDAPALNLPSANSCRAQTLVTFTANPCGGGPSVTRTASFVVVDSLAPQWVQLPDDMEVSCGNVNPSNTGRPVAQDPNCRSDDPSECVVLEYTDQYQSRSSQCSLPQSIVRTWTARDQCGNAIVAQQRLAVSPNCPDVPECPDVCEECPTCPTEPRGCSCSASPSPTPTRTPSRSVSPSRDIPGPVPPAPSRSASTSPSPMLPEGPTVIPVPPPGSPGDDDDDEFDNNNDFLDDDDGVNDIGNRICCFICEEYEDNTSFPYTRDDNVITVNADDDDDDDNFFSSFFTSRTDEYDTDPSRNVNNPSPASVVLPSRSLSLVLLFVTFFSYFLF